MVIATLINRAIVSRWQPPFERIPTNTGNQIQATNYCLYLSLVNLLYLCLRVLSVCGTPFSLISRSRSYLIHRLPSRQAPPSHPHLRRLQNPVFKSL